LDWNLFTSEGLEFHGRMNLTKAGLLAADCITTVSRKYAQETMTPAMGLGLEGVLMSCQDRLVPVQNGIDYAVWSPAGDNRLAAVYSPDDLSGKEKCRLRLAELFGFADSGPPAVSMVCRLLSRKGLDIVIKAMDRMMNLPINLAVMGLGEAHYQDFLAEAAERWPGRVGYKRANDQVLLRQIMAGSDICIMPSRFEPCGLEQLYALSYGAVPVVRGTGGLDDTVVDLTDNPEEGTGYKFDEYSAEAFLAALGRAVRDFGDRDRWLNTVRRGMAGNFSWDNSAAQYELVYRKALETAGKRA
jgi:starch synthase